MKNLLTKKSILIFSAILILVSSSAIPLYQSIHVYHDFFKFVRETFLPFSLEMLIFSLITYKLRDSIFTAWRDFSFWFVPLSTLLILIAPDSGGGMLYPSMRAMATMLLPSIYGLVSIAIILSKYLSLRHK